VMVTRTGGNQDTYRIEVAGAPNRGWQIRYRLISNEILVRAAPKDYRRWQETGGGRYIRKRLTTKFEQNRSLMARKK
jgi:hypothetical protein